MRSAALYEPQALDALLTRAAAGAPGVDWNLVGRLLTAELSLAAVDAAIE